MDYESVPHRLTALIWPEDSADEIRALVGAENVNVTATGIQVRNEESEWVTLGDGWAVALTDRGTRDILSSTVLSGKYRPVVR
jgi:hypothetical protein